MMNKKAEKYTITKILRDIKINDKSLSIQHVTSKIQNKKCMYIHFITCSSLWRLLSTIRYLRKDNSHIQCSKLLSKYVSYNLIF